MAAFAPLSLFYRSEARNQLPYITYPQRAPRIPKHAPRTPQRL